MLNPLASVTDIEGLLPKAPVATNDEIQDLALKEHDHEKRKEDAERQWKERRDADEQQEHQTERLIRYITDAFQEAKNAKACNGIDQKILDGRRLRKGEYTPEEKQKLDGIDVWLPAIKTLSRAGAAYISTIVTEDPNHNLWDLKPSRLPQLPEAVVEEATEIATQELEAALEQEGFQLLPGELEERVNLMRETLFKAIDREAEVRTRNLKRKVESNLQIADWDRVFYKEFFEDLFCDPCAHIKGPVVAAKPIKEWRNGELKWPKRKYQHYETVSADRIFPSADSTDPHNGVFLIHLNRMTRSDLVQAQRLKGFIAENIEILLCEFEEKCIDWLSPIETQMEILENRQGTWREDEYIDVIEYHGRVPGHLLKTMGIERYKGSRLNDKDQYEYEIWVIDNHIIRAQPAANPDKRPFHKTSLYPICGSYWGDSLPHIAEDLQRTANALYRAMVRDVGYTSGPYFEYDVGLQDMQLGGVPSAMRPGLTLKKNSLINPTKGDIMKAHRVPSQAGLYMQLLDQVFLQMEQATGVNRQMLGQAQPGVNTLGETQLLSANTATGLRAILKNIDHDIIEPVIEMTACQIMMTTDDATLKADARAIAFGSGSMLTREINRDRKLQVLQTILPFYQQQPSIIEPDGIAYLLRQIMEDLGEENPDLIVKDPESVLQQKIELQAAINAAGGGLGGGESLPGVAGGGAQPPATPAVGFNGPNSDPIQSAPEG